MAKVKKKWLWKRILKCGHSRTTDISYLVDDTEIPIVGERCYCRLCYNFQEIVDVIDVSNDKKLIENLEAIRGRIKKDKKMRGNDGFKKV